jgi:hypothetical protein
MLPVVGFGRFMMYNIHLEVVEELQDTTCSSLLLAIKETLWTRHYKSRSFQELSQICGSHRRNQFKQRDPRSRVVRTKGTCRACVQKRAAITQIQGS